ncbi:hypothetical protein WMY93_013080 [Mugilogobius chulae]|uniref:Uncharacterized protein n=1 Tax=Mugilogobius chulae TaxID=88201 RepID=A0AAW0P534_9GOBI
MDYKVIIHTGNNFNSTTFNKVYIKLVGEHGESVRTQLTGLKGVASFFKGTTSKFSVHTNTDIGKVVLIELDKHPNEKVYVFPIYRWISDVKVHRFREGTALRVLDDTHHLGRYSRELELKERGEDYSWDVYADGLPHCIKTSGPLSLPSEVQFSFTKTTEFLYTASTGITELKLKGLDTEKSQWTNFEEINKVFCNKTTNISEYVKEHWREDAFFGYQFLNGVNPILIRRCTSLPGNFPVTDKIVFPQGHENLRDEMQKGNIFLCDYKNMEGAGTNVIDDKQQYLAAPLVLLHKTPDNELKPVAIQLKQSPSEDNPIFVPTDSEYDWLLAKTFKPAHGPSLHKLLIPHTRYTLQINFLARLLLIQRQEPLHK